ncbi:MAG: flavodoxin [Clostridiales bacterium]|nr:flavodoxin [Clostridiales bacterium]
MKRIISLFLLICMITVLTACGFENTESSSDSENSAASNTNLQPEIENESEETDISVYESSDEESDSTSADNKILVAYFSCTGTTEQIAEWIAEETGAELYEIIPDTPYTEDDLNYNDSSSRANQEQADSSARPAIAGSVENMENYDVIFLGYPIWHGQAPRIISTFLESYDFSDVMMIPFCTSHSSGIGSSAENLHSLCAETVTWEEGRRFSGDAVKSDVEAWIESLELPD